MNIKEEIHAAYPDLVTLRRWFHTHPELSEKEFRTMDYIEARLKEYGIPFVRVPRGGILATIDSGRPGFHVLLRADIDALPIQEAKQNLGHARVCISENPGVMHACGHDGHMSMQLIAGRILNAHKDEWDGKVYLMFEEGEENGSKFILQLLKYIDDNQIHIDACYATHVRWNIPAGKVTILPGPVMAGVFAYQIRLVGAGGHGSRPDLAKSPIDCFVSCYDAFQGIRMNDISPEATLTFSIGTLHAGTAKNVIPGSLSFGGTCRYFEEDQGKLFREKFYEALDDECRRHQCQWEKDGDAVLLPVYNNPVCAKIAIDAVKENLGEDALYDGGRWMASESFARTLAKWPGILAFTGIEDPDVGSGANHHTAEFDIGEKGLINGVGTALSYTLAMLKQKPQIPFTAREKTAGF